MCIETEKVLLSLQYIRLRKGLNKEFAIPIGEVDDFLIELSIIIRGINEYKLDRNSTHTTID